MSTLLSSLAKGSGPPFELSMESNVMVVTLLLLLLVLGTILSIVNSLAFRQGITSVASQMAGFPGQNSQGLVKRK